MWVNIGCRLPNKATYGSSSFVYISVLKQVSLSSADWQISSSPYQQTDVIGESRIKLGILATTVVLSPDCINKLESYILPWLS